MAQGFQGSTGGSSVPTTTPLTVKYGITSFNPVTNGNSHIGGYQEVLSLNIAGNNYSAFKLSVLVKSNASGMVLVSADMDIHVTGNGSGGADLVYTVQNTGINNLKKGDFEVYFNNTTKDVKIYRKIYWAWEGVSFSIDNYRGSQTLTWLEAFLPNLSGEVNNAWASKIEVYTDNRSWAVQLACSDLTTALTTGTSKGYFRMPYSMNVTEVMASVLTAPTGTGNLTVDINKNGTSILSTKLTFDAGEKTTVTASTPAVISTSAFALDDEVTVDIDAVSGTVTGTGLIVTLIGERV